MPKPKWRSRYVAYGLFAACVLVTACSVNSIVPDPYMDEIFHVRQAQAYTRGWNGYDPKLTTPPGLYIPSALIARYVSTAGASIPALRAVNALLLLFLPFLISDLLGLIRDSSLPQAPLWRRNITEGLVITSFPLVFFYGFLYYTDVASLVLVLLVYRQALRKSYVASALAGLASLTIRQTNILWVAYATFEALLLELEQSERGTGRSLKSTNQLMSLKTSMVLSSIHQFMEAAFRQPKLVARVVSPYVPVGVAFLAFLVWNAGIVLGDKTMHVAVLHIPQIYYFAAFAGCLMVPHIIDAPIVRQTCRTLFGSLSRLGRSLLLSSGIALSIWKYTVVHPFLLADNRHYPFYIWRRIINRHAYSRYTLAPMYLGCGTALWYLTARSRDWGILPFIAYWAVTCLTLIPSPLLEFRYFIIPFIILRMHVRPSSQKRMFLEGSMYFGINLVTIALFLFRPFTWPDEEGWQRFMW